MLAALFLLGSFPMAFAEEAEVHEHDGCCEMLADGGIVPLVARAGRVSEADFQIHDEIHAPQVYLQRI